MAQTETEEFIDKAEAALEGISPGEWVRVPPVNPKNADEALDCGVEAGGKIIAEAFGRVGVTDYRPARTNAAFIAAAPTLLREAIVLLKAAGEREAASQLAGEESSELLREATMERDHLSAMLDSAVCGWTGSLPCPSGNSLSPVDCPHSDAHEPSGRYEQLNGICAGCIRQALEEDVPPA